MSLSKSNLNLWSHQKWRRIWSSFQNANIVNTSLLCLESTHGRKQNYKARENNLHPLLRRLSAVKALIATTAPAKTVLQPVIIFTLFCCLILLELNTTLYSSVMTYPDLTAWPLWPQKLYSLSKHFVNYVQLWIPPVKYLKKVHLRGYSQRKIFDTLDCLMQRHPL